MEGELPPLARPLLTNRDETKVGFTDDWTPSRVKVALNLTLNAEFVPASANVRDLSSLPGAPSGCRAAVARVVALDGLIDKTALGWIREHLGVDIEDERRHGGAKPRESLWERKTADDDLAEPTYGLRKESMDRLVRTMTHREGVEPTTRLDEFHARLQALYPDWIVCHMPADALRADEEASEKPDDSLDAFAGGSARFRCDAFVANAAVHGDEYRWHVDADPSSFPDSCAWTRTRDSADDQACERTEAQPNGRTSRRADAGADARTNERTDDPTHEQASGRAENCADVRTNQRTRVWRGVRVHE